MKAAVSAEEETIIALFIVYQSSDKFEVVVFLEFVLISGKIVLLYLLFELGKYVRTSLLREISLDKIALTRDTAGFLKRVGERFKL